MASLFMKIPESFGLTEVSIRHSLIILDLSLHHVMGEKFVGPTQGKADCNRLRQSLSCGPGALESCS